MPGMPSHAGSVTESSFAVHTRPVGHRLLETKPFRAGRAVAFPVQPRVVGENLESGANDERHEKQVQEMLQPEPGGESRGDGHRGGRDARVAHEEILHRRDLPQCLRDGHADHQQYESNRQCPQHVDPALTDPDPGNHACLRRQPVIQANPVVRGAQTCLQRIMRGCRLNVCHPISSLQSRNFLVRQSRINRLDSD